MLQPDSAIKELIRCTALARIVYGDGHWKLASSYVNLAQGYFDLKGTETTRGLLLVQHAF